MKSVRKEMKRINNNIYELFPGNSQLEVFITAKGKINLSLFNLSRRDKSCIRSFYGKNNTFPGVRAHRTVVASWRPSSSPSSSSSSPSSSSSSDELKDLKVRFTTLLPFQSTISSPKETLVICTPAGVRKAFSWPPSRARCLKAHLRTTSKGKLRVVTYQIPRIVDIFKLNASYRREKFSSSRKTPGVETPLIDHVMRPTEFRKG